MPVALRPRHMHTDPPGGWLLIGAGCLLFVFAAVGLEVVAATYANSPAPAWGDYLPLAWPPASRVAWWLAVAGAAAGFRLALSRVGFRQHPVMVVVSVAPFVVFALAIAAGAEWATWH